VDRSSVGPCGGGGGLDKFLISFYENDIKNNKLTEEKAQEIVAEFVLKRPYWYGIGGRDKNLKDATNKVSWLFLNACDMLKEPINVAVLWHEDIDKDFFKRACEIEIKKGSGTPMLMNYDVMRKSVINYGIGEEDAWDVAYNGCAWYSVPGKEYLCGDISGINLSVCLKNALDLAFKLNIKNFDEIWNLFSIEVEEAIKALKDLMDAEVEQFPKIWPEILPSLMTYGCIEKGRDITDLGTQYNFPIVQFLGASNAADSLVAMKKVVFEDKMITLDVLESALITNFEGYESVRGYLLNCPKFGNDDDEADQMAVNVIDMVRDKLAKYKSANGFSFRPAMWSHLGHIYAGMMLGATPDGRKAGEPIAQGPNPMHGRNVNGVSATARSLAKLRPEWLLECPYQLELDPSILFDISDRVKLMTNIIIACFKMGLVQLQANIFTLDTLKKALKKPDEYRNLVVRVTGFSARFVELNKESQKEVMSRYRQSAN
jgi:formate C-acetyltransferase